MSEKLNIQPEAERPGHESSSNERHHEVAGNRSERVNEAGRQEQLEALRHEVSKEAKAADEVRRSKSESERNIPPNPPAKRELQKMMRQRTLNRIRKELPVTERVFSKLIHAKPVEAVSTVGEKTIARPYGLLGGGLAALIGSSTVFYMAKTYGFRYNLILFFTFFVAGYILATVIEVLVRLTRAKR